MQEILICNFQLGNIDDWPTYRCLVAGISREAIRTDTDEGSSCSSHTSATITAHIHFTVVTCRQRVGQVEWFWTVYCHTMTNRNKQLTGSWGGSRNVPIKNNSTDVSESHSWSALSRHKSESIHFPSNGVFLNMTPALAWSFTSVDMWELNILLLYIIFSGCIRILSWYILRIWLHQYKLVGGLSRSVFFWH